MSIQSSVTIPAEKPSISSFTGAASRSGRPSERKAGDVSQKLAPLSLRKNFSWTFVGNIVYAGSQWGMLVLLAKLGTPETVGKFALGLAVTAPVILFANLQLRSIQATDARGQFEFRDYLGLRLITTVLALLAIGVITLTSGYARDTAIVVLIVGVAKAFEAISDVIYGLVQQHERMDRIAKAMMIKGPLSLAMLAIGVLVGGIVGGVIGLTAAWATVLVTYDLRSSARILRDANDDGPRTAAEVAAIMRPRFDRAILQKLAWLALPLGFAMMLISLNTNIPRYFIERYFGEGQLGIFAAMAYLMVAGTTIVSALAQSASPRLAKYYADKNRAAFQHLFLRLISIGAVLGLAGVLVAQVAGKFVLELLYQPEYAKHNDVFVLVAVAAGLGYMSTFAGWGMTATRQFRIQTVLFGLAVGVMALASLWLIPTQGLRGAGKALIISGLVQFVGSLVIVMVALYTQQRQEKAERARAAQAAKSEGDRPIRVLHVLGAMNRGGVETWLMHVLRNINYDRYHIDFLVHTTEPAAFDEEIRALGSKIIPCLDPKQPILYARNFRKVLKEHGPYDVVHSHVHHYSGWVLWQAARAGIPVRISHSHNDSADRWHHANILRRGYLALTTWLVQRYSTRGLACSARAAAALYGPEWHTEPRYQVLHYTIDLTPFELGRGDDVIRKSLRAELGLPEDAFVMGHVGRFMEQKNHEFLIDVAAEVFKRADDVRLLLVGDGELRSAVEEKVARLGITDKVIFAGVRSDVPSLMLNVFDTFVFTSTFEGLGIVLVEAQAAGLPCVYGEGVPHEADIVPPLLHRMTLKQSPAEWAEVVLAQRNAEHSITQTEALDEVKKSPFNIETNMKRLEILYQ